MDPLVMSDALPVRVAAGGEARVPITVQNPGEAADSYRCDVLGDPAGWSRIEPRHLPGIAGGDRAAVELVLRPPPGTTPGCHPVGVRCVSLQDGSRTGVVDGEVTVGGEHGIEVAAVPIAPRGRRAGHYAVEVRNTGAVEVEVGLSATDPRQELGVALAPRELAVPPGESATAYLSVRPRRPRLGGGPVVHRFRVEHRAGSAPGARLPVSFEQRPVLGGVGTAAVAVLAAGLAVLGGLLVWPGVRGLLPGEGPAASVAPSPGPDGSGGAGAPGGTGGSGGDPVQGYIALYGTAAAEDAAGRTGLEEMLVQLQAAGVPAELVDSSRSERLDDGYWVLLQDGLADLAAARSACELHRDIAPGCSPVAPG